MPIICPTITIMHSILKLGFLVFVHLTDSRTQRIIPELHPTTGIDSWMRHYNQNTDCLLKQEKGALWPLTKPFASSGSPCQLGSCTSMILIPNHHNALGQSLRNLVSQHDNASARFSLNCGWCWRHWILPLVICKKLIIFLALLPMVQC